MQHWAGIADIYKICHWAGIADIYKICHSRFTRFSEIFGVFFFFQKLESTTWRSPLKKL